MNQDTKVVKISEVIESQIPDFILSENPNFSEFLKQYYISQEYQGSTIDLAENLVSYKNIDSFDGSNLVKSTRLTSEVDFFDDEIFVSSTSGWPSQYGLLKINDEIITYTGITSTSFTGCIRGFSGIETLSDEDNPGVLKFSSTEISSHDNNSVVNNLSNLFLLEFFKKIKYQFTPGFEEFDFDTRIDPQNFISKAKDFYRTKGTNEAFKILFKVLYGENVEVINPKDYLFAPSDSKWIVAERFIGELVSGNPSNINGQTLYQDPLEGVSERANGSIYEVSLFSLDNKKYYNIDIFSGQVNNLNPKGSIFGEFKTTPKSYAISDVSSGADTISVLSTAGFPSSGNLEVNGITVSYKEKTSTEFLKCSNITRNISVGSEVFGSNYVYAYENGNTNSIVKFKLLNTISSIGTDNTKLSVEGDLLKVQNLGITESNVFTKSLIYNVPTSIYGGMVYDQIPQGKFGISKSSGIVKTKYPNHLKNGDFVDVFSVTENRKLYTATVSNVNNDTDYQFTITGSQDLRLNHTIKFRRVAKKSSSSTYTEINQKYLTNIQSSYEDDNNYYLSSNGFFDGTIDPVNRKYNLQISINNVGISSLVLGEHNLFDGDIVTVENYSFRRYQNDFTFRNLAGITTGLNLYVKKVDSNELKFSYTKNDLLNELYVNFSELDSYNKVGAAITTLSVSYSSLYGKEFKSIKAFKKISKTPKNPIFKDETPPGSIGILVNGVEIQNPKSYDRIYNGKIKSINILNPGNNYNLLNPPKFEVNLGSDTQTKLYPSLKGKIESVLVTDPGYDYLEVPNVVIEGGNSKGVKTSVSLRKTKKDIIFSANDSEVVVTLDPFNKFVFPTNHRLVPGDAVVYTTSGNNPIGIGTEPQDGFLSNGGTYYISNIGAGTSFSLFPTYNDAITGINTINLRTRGTGIQKFTTVKDVNVINEVNIIGSELSFEYKELPFTTENINKYDDIFNIKGHGLNDGEEVVYSYDGTSLSGLSTSTFYYVKKVDGDRFKLFSNKLLTGNPINVNFDSSNSNSIYTISYSPIRISISGKLTTIGISTIGLSAELYPVIRGQITDVRVQNSQTYGNTHLNVESSPKISLKKGKSCYLKPIISNGKIIDVIVSSSGSNYFNSVEIKVNGSGVGAKLHPVVQNGEIINVKIIRTGINYDQYTTLEVIEVGTGAYLTSSLEYWTLNETSKFDSNSLNKGILIGSNYPDRKQIGIYNLTDSLKTQFNISRNSHSPIIGWSYDGCPIYGPYAYRNVNGTGSIIEMTSSYKKVRRSPSNSNSTNLDSIEDYVYEKGLGTLDEHNGRYCVTPEYPNGVYAYFATSSYPFFIGPKYAFSKIPENFNKEYDQDVDINSLGITKHTYPYYVDDLENYYEFFDYNPSLYKEDFVVLETKSGSLDSLKVIYPGENYKIGDEITFNDQGTSGYGAKGVVTKLIGVGISSIKSETSNYSNITFISNGSEIVGLSSQTLNLKNNYFVSITGISSTSYKDLEGRQKITVKTVKTGLTTSISPNTGIVTSIQVSDTIFNFDIDSKIQIGTETLTIIGIDYKNNSLIVKRGDQGLSHSVQSEVSLLTDKFSFANSDDLQNLIKDETYYFNSNLISVGLNTTPGSGNAITKYPLGYGISETRFVRTGGIWMPNHKFVNGEEVIYELGADSTEISTSIDNGDYLQNIKPLYIIDLGNDIVGFTNDKTKINTTDGLIYFASSGSGHTHKLKTKRNIVTGSITFNETLISTTSNHNLSVDDIVELDVKVGTTTNYSVTHSTSTSRISLNSSVNPKITAYENQIINFDLSSSSLSGIEFKLYKDSNFENEYFGSGVIANEVGIGTSSLTLTINEYTPRTLYYFGKSTTKSINPDTSVVNYNTIQIIPSLYNYEVGIVTHTQNTFTINLPDRPENDYYVSLGSTTLKYNILSSNARGPIKDTRLTFRGKNYKKIPSIVSIGNSGTNAKLYPYSENIGKILRISPNVNNIYPSDKTLNPKSNLYSTVYLKDNYKVKEVNLTAKGSNYLSAPKVKLYNEITNIVYDQFSAYTTLKDTSVNEIVITNPGFGFPEVGNKIVFIENTNGLKILEATKQQTSPDTFLVSLRLETPLSGFTTSTPIPFEVGDKIFVEGIVGTGNGFNSENYSYNYFEIVGIVTSYSSPNQSIIRYNLNRDPGTPTSYNFAYVANEKNIAKASLKTEFNSFFPGEKIDNTNAVNNLKNQNYTNSYVNVYDSSDIGLNDTISGKNSNSKGTVVKIDDYQSKFAITESYSKPLGSLENKSYLSSIVQKISDNDYYQNFSYTLKSNVEIQKWDAPVSDLAHISGFKQFSDLTVESVGVSSITTENIPSVNVILDSFVNINTINDIDLVTENVDENQNLYSDIINFNTIKLTDYLLSNKNRVLSIDDISLNFDNDATSAIIDIDVLPTFGSGSFVSKYFALIEGTTSLYTDFELPLLAEIFMTRNGSTVNLISYSYFEDIPLGSFYAQINPEDNNEIQLQFIPFNINNIYSARLIGDTVPLDQVSTTEQYGVTKSIGINTYFASSSSPSSNYINLVSLDDCKSGYCYVGIGTSNGHISEFCEFTFTYSNNILTSNKYSDTEIKDLGTVGIATNGNNISIQFTPIPNTNTFLYANADVFVNTSVSPDFSTVEYGKISSSRVQFTNTNLNPISISTVTSDFSASKYIIEVKKTVGVTTEVNIIQINSLHYNVIPGQEKYLNNIDYGIIGKFEDLEFETVFDEPSQTYTLVYYPNELATYDIKFYQKSLERSTNPLLI